MLWSLHSSRTFVFHDTSPTEIYTLSLHDALPILKELYAGVGITGDKPTIAYCRIGERSSHTWFALTELLGQGEPRSEEHTSELQSLRHLVCRLLLEKKKQNTTAASYTKATELARA